MVRKMLCYKSRKASALGMDKCLRHNHRKFKIMQLIEISIGVK